MKLKDKVAIVTGGSRGIGKAICLDLAKQGAKVVVNYSKNIEAGEQVVDEIKKAGGEASIYQCSVESLEDVNGMITDTLEKYERIDILVNNAGITRDGFLMMMKEEQWKDVININLIGAFNCVKAVSRHMIDKKRGVIINISSTSGINGVPAQTNYCASKAGLIGFTKSLAREMASFNIRVNCVAPGLIETEMVSKIPEKLMNKYIADIPARRLGRPSEVAKVVSFLASDDSSYILGEVIVVDGGMVA